MSEPDLPLSPEDVAEIVAILDGTPHERLEIRTRRFALRLSRVASGAAEGWTQEWEWNGGGQTSAAAEATVEAEVAGAVRAPLPGTFYRAPSPGAPPFVEVGAMVGPETVVGIIETMKLMNPVHAGGSGRIGEIIVENGAMVDGGAILMRIEA